MTLLGEQPLAARPSSTGGKPMNRWAGCLLVLAAAACTDSVPVPAAVESRSDSAGIEIVSSPDRTEVFATLASTPELVIGGIDASEPALFSAVAGLHIQQDGSIWVADEDAADIRIFGADGEHIRTVGGRGEGPEEFSTVQILGALEDESVVVADPYRRRVSLYGSSGEFLRTERIEMGPSLPLIHGVLRDGGLVAQLEVELEPEVIVSGGVVGDSSHFVVWDPPAADPTPLGTAPTQRTLFSGRNLAPVPFTSSAGVATSSVLWATTGHRFELRSFDRSGIVRLLRIERAPQSVGDSLRDAYRAWVLERSPSPSPSRTLMLDVVDHSAVPDHRPAFDDLVLSLDGSLWARRWVFGAGPGPRTWDVFNPEGVYVGHVTTPAEFALEAADNKALWGVWTDELGVDYVHRYRFTRAELTQG